jgi:flagellin-like protein
MEINNIFTDDEAVSPVIGVILMVAITVILAAVIGAFVLGIGGSQTQTPQASWEWESTTSSAYSVGSNDVQCASGGSTYVKVTHQGGDEINADQLELDGTDCTSSDTEITAGDALINNDASSGTVTLVWKSPSSDDTSILSDYEV